MKNLCLAGGVALNCVGNGRILREGPFDNIWIQPAAGDAGGALGVALHIWYQLLGKPRTPGRTRRSEGVAPRPAFLRTPRSGPFSTPRGRSTATSRTTTQLDAEIVDLIEGEKVVGLFQGRMEFGPRALGCRSIIGDARSRKMQSVMNLKIKFRESFRPFAPIVLRERVSEYFEMDDETDSPYMLLVADVAEDKRLPVEEDGATGLDKLKGIRSVVPAITHVDNSARVQTVDPERHARLHRLMTRFRGAYRVSGDDQHVVQRPRRAHRVRARARLPLFHGHRHGRAGVGELPPPQGGATEGGRPRSRRLPRPVRVGLGEPMSVVQINRDPTLRQLRQFGWIWMAFVAFFGAVAWFKFHNPALARGLWIAAVVVPVLGWAVPVLHAPGLSGNVLPRVADRIRGLARGVGRGLLSRTDTDRSR